MRKINSVEELPKEIIEQIELVEDEKIDNLEQIFIYVKNSVGLNKKPKKKNS